MATAGAGRSLNGWTGRRLKRVHPLYARVQWGDTDGADGLVWADWFFGQAAAPIDGQLAATLGPATSAASAALALSGAGSVQLGMVTLSASARLALRGGVSAALDAATASGGAALSLQSGLAGSLDHAVCAAEARITLRGQAACQLDTATCAGAAVIQDAAEPKLSLSAIAALVDAIWSTVLPLGSPPAFTPGLETLDADEIDAIRHAVWSRSLPL